MIVVVTLFRFVAWRKHTSIKLDLQPLTKPVTAILLVGGRLPVHSRCGIASTHPPLRGGEGSFHIHGDFSHVDVAGYTT